MIRHPRVGQVVQVHYAKHYAAHMPHHGKIGVVRIAARGPGPRNHGIEFEDGTFAAIPAGNLCVPPAHPTTRRNPHEHADRSMDARSRSPLREEPAPE